MLDKCFSNFWCNIKNFKLDQTPHTGFKMTIKLVLFDLKNGSHFETCTEKKSIDVIGCLSLCFIFFKSFYFSPLDSVFFSVFLKPSLSMFYP